MGNTKDVTSDATPGIDWQTCTLDEIVQERNRIQFIVENIDGLAETCKLRFFHETCGVANRHITRIVSGTLPLIAARDEIKRCLQDADKIANELAKTQERPKRWYLEIQVSDPNRMKESRALVLCAEGTGKRIPFNQFISGHSKKALIELLDGSKELEDFA